MPSPQHGRENSDPPEAFARPLMRAICSSTWDALGRSLGFGLIMCRIKPTRCSSAALRHRFSSVSNQCMILSRLAWKDWSCRARRVQVISSEYPMHSVMTSRKTHPIANMSDAERLGSNFATSGLKYLGVPRSPLSVRLDGSSEKSVAEPKSVIQRLSADSTMFDGFKSLCFMPE